MKQRNFPLNQSEKPNSASKIMAAADLIQGPIDFAPSADEVARKAYFSYVNEGSLPGRDVQHWLAAEAELTAERNRTRVHGFHNHN